MTASNPYTIAFFSNNFHSEYCHVMYSGLLSAVAEFGVSLVTVCGGDLDNPQYNNARRNRVFDLVNTDDFDGIIFQSGSLHNYTNDEIFLKFCARFDKIPSVHIGFKRDGFSSVIVDNKTGMRALIDHFIEDHNRKKIAFILGPQGCMDADDRFDAYKDSLQEHGLPFREDLVYLGTFLPESGPNAIREFIDVKKIAFDALVGANDQMALFAMNDLVRRGIRIPADVIIGGFDDLITARACSPALCTVRQPVQELGREALKLLIDIIKGNRDPGTCLNLPSRLILRRSCGCTSVSFSGIKKSDSLCPDRYTFEKQFEYTLKNEMTSCIEFLEEQVIAFLRNGYDLTDLLSCIGNILDVHAKELSPDLHNGIRRILLTIMEEHHAIKQLKQQDDADLLYNFIDDLRKISEPDDLRIFFNAQCINIGIKKIFIARYKNIDTAELFFSSIPNQREVVFNARLLVPGGLKSLSAPFNLVCLPLFSNESDLGYFICNPVESNPVFLETIRSSLCGAFQIMDLIAKEREYGHVLERRVGERTSELQQALHELSLLNDRLEKISIRDDLTGLLNRRGFLSMAERYIALAERNKTPFICIFIDLDNLKYVNDTFGHAHGDIAIKSIARILSAVFRKTDILARMGGDEFTVLAFNCTDAGYELKMHMIDKEVQNYNQTSGNQWKLAYSSGFASSEHEQIIDIDALMKRADQKLYKTKKEKKNGKTI
jgi:diguanylate cyclase (GGDEF)-like protein